MAPLPIALADTLNALVRQGRVVVSETRERMAVYQLNGHEADGVLVKLAAAGWTDAQASDDGGPIPRAMVVDAREGVRVTANRPVLPAGVDAVLTHSGFEALLRRTPSSQIVWVHGVKEAIDTTTVRYAPPHHVGAFVPSDPLPDAGRVVRVLGPGEPGGHLGRWVLRESEADVMSPAMSPWRKMATARLLATMAQEIEPDGRLMFHGPPPTRFSNNPTDLPSAHFASVQRTADWLLKNAGEFENKHGLLAAEVARTSIKDGEAVELAGMLASSLEGAKIAYQFGLTRQSADTLKSLGDLRRAVSDEAAKLSDTTRSLATAILAGVLGNVALIAARLTLSPGATFVGTAATVLAGVLFLHVLATVATGIHYICIQRETRSNWRQRLYRFLPDDEYDRMVNRPARRAETGFWIATGFGILSAFGLLVAVYLIVSAPAPSVGGVRADTVVPTSSRTAAPRQIADEMQDGRPDGDQSLEPAGRLQEDR